MLASEPWLRWFESTLGCNIFTAFFGVMATWVVPYMAAIPYTKATKEEIVSWVRAAQQGDIAARNRVITHHMRLVHMLARKYFVLAGNEYEDVIQSAVIGGDPEKTGGMIRAIELFDCDAGIAFSTYARNWILLAILDILGKRGGAPGRRALTRANKLKRKIEKQTLLTGEAPETSELLENGMREDTAERLINGVKLKSFEKMHEDAEQRWFTNNHALLPTQLQHSSHEDAAIERLDCQNIKEAIYRLPPLQKEILFRAVIEQETLESIGKSLVPPLCRQHVQVLRDRAMRTVRRCVPRPYPQISQTMRDVA